MKQAIASNDVRKLWGDVETDTEVESCGQSDQTAGHDTNQMCVASLAMADAEAIPMAVAALIDSCDINPAARDLLIKDITEAIVDAVPGSASVNRLSPGGFWLVYEGLLTQWGTGKHRVSGAQVDAGGWSPSVDLLRCAGNNRATVAAKLFGEEFGARVGAIGQKMARKQN